MSRTAPGVEYMIVTDYFTTVQGPLLTRENLGVVPEAWALDEANVALRKRHATKVEVWSREVPDWSKVEEISAASCVPGEPE